MRDPDAKWNASVVAATCSGLPCSSKSWEGILGEGLFLYQAGTAPFNLCGHDTSLELEQVMNF